MREIMDEFILVPIGEAMLSLKGMFALNPVGAEIWKMLEKESNNRLCTQKPFPGTVPGNGFCNFA